MFLWLFHFTEDTYPGEDASLNLSVHSVSVEHTFLLEKPYLFVKTIKNKPIKERPAIEKWAS